ncbi:MAG: hypothetical protein JSU95_03775 [Betaproteobacteria bacterium]|nr:MAG: hypothetical protein JSU95_03775 [Betaproteobacteria bacterium]
MSMVLRLNEDRLPAGGAPAYLPAIERVIYVLEGDATVEFASGCAYQATGSAWLGGEELALIPGPDGARVLRWELDTEFAGDRGMLVAAPGAGSEGKHSEEIGLDSRFGWLMRCDRVSFPKGGIAYTHVHQGPGIRYCLEGQIEIQSEGRSDYFGPGEAWFESGLAPVLAITSKEMETAFVRCFVLPRSCKGRPSIRYVNAEDAAKPKTQRYKVLGERFIEVVGA